MSVATKQCQTTRSFVSTLCQAPVNGVLSRKTRLNGQKADVSPNRGHMAVGQNPVPVVNIKLGSQMDVHPPQNGAIDYAPWPYRERGDASWNGAFSGGAMRKSWLPSACHHRWHHHKQERKILHSARPSQTRKAPPNDGTTTNTNKIMENFAHQTSRTKQKTT